MTLTVCGKTIDDKLVVKGLFNLFDTEGIPLYILFELCNKENYMPSWIDFYNEAYKHGWKHKTIINRLKEGMKDIYKSKFIDIVIARLQ